MKKIGLKKAPQSDSGQGIGIIIFDSIVPHPSSYHLKDRVKLVRVQKDQSIICSNPFDNLEVKWLKRGDDHGLKVLQLLTHQHLSLRVSTIQV